MPATRWACVCVCVCMSIQHLRPLTRTTIIFKKFFSLEIVKIYKKKYLKIPAAKPLNQSLVLFGAQFRLSELSEMSNNTLVHLYIPELFVQFWYVPRLSSWVCTRIVPTILVRKNGTLGIILVLNEWFSNFGSVTSLRIYTRR